MADMLCEPEDIAAMLERDLDAYKTTMLVEAATAVVQEAADRPPQRIVLVEDAEHQILGGMGAWLDLPQRPVQSIASVTIDGETLTAGTDYIRSGSRLWRETGWQEERHKPTLIDVTYTHGYPDGSQELQLARSAVLSLVRGVYGNPTGALSVRIDDYSASYGKFTALMETTDYLRTALQRQYGRRAAMVRLG